MSRTESSRGSFSGIRPVQSLLLAALSVLLAACALCPPAAARTSPPLISRGEAVEGDGWQLDLPARAPGVPRADTIQFGYFQEIGGAYYAVQGETWTWDHGSSNLAEGWYAIDQTTNPAAWFRRITPESWSADPYNPLPAPIIAGNASAWIGFFESEARALCWDAGLGYGDGWCQRLVSPALTYTGTGEVTLSFRYFNDTEWNYDYTKVFLEGQPTRLILNPWEGFNDRIGRWDAPETFARTISNADFGGGSQPREFRIAFEMVSDGGWSDEDGEWDTAYGAFAADDIILAGALEGGSRTYDFEPGWQGWTTAICPGIGSYFGIAPLDQYVIQDPCACRLSGNVVEMHADSGPAHLGQWEMICSPAVDRRAFPSYNAVLAEWDQYSELPRSIGVFYRVGWSYYPYTCPTTGESIWSERVGEYDWHYTGDEPICEQLRNVATEVPASCEQVRFIYEVVYSCDAWWFPCDANDTNFTPLVDNVRIRITTVPVAPLVTIDPGGRFQDGFPRDGTLSPTDPGNADIARDMNQQGRLGDSLVVTGPAVNAGNRFLCRLWFRVRREGPGTASMPEYQAWKSRVADGLDITGDDAQFTYGWMDSVETGTSLPPKNRFCSQFNEIDDDWTAPEQGEANEIIQDVLPPGTRIEYFVTSAHICTPSVYYRLPDTTGGNFYEFEILPSYRRVGSADVFPCVLYVDPAGKENTRLIETALDRALNGAPPGHPVPALNRWDRYDDLDASSSWHAPLFRIPGGTAGATLSQLLGYRTILLDTGDLGPEGMDPRDFQGYAEWLTSTGCGSDLHHQAWHGSGDNLAAAITATWPAFLTEFCGASLLCPDYNASGCPGGEGENDQQYCVGLEPSPGAPFVPDQPADLWGNWCPPKFFYDVLAPVGSGVGTRNFAKVGTGQQVGFAQVVHDAYEETGKYRTTLSGYSLAHLANRDPDHPGPSTECPNDFESIVAAAADQLRDELGWGICVEDPAAMQLCGCEEPWTDACASSGVAEEGAAAPVDRLDGAGPNPFNPRTTIRYSLARGGAAELVIYDASGRKVRTLVDGPQTAGPHQAVWNGADDAGRRLPAGVYWSRLRAGDFSSNRKMVVLR